MFGREAASANPARKPLVDISNSKGASATIVFRKPPSRSSSPLKPSPVKQSVVALQSPITTPIKGSAASASPDLRNANSQQHTKKSIEAPAPVEFPDFEFDVVAAFAEDLDERAKRGPIPVRERVQNTAILMPALSQPSPKTHRTKFMQTNFDLPSIAEVPEPLPTPSPPKLHPKVSKAVRFNELPFVKIITPRPAADQTTPAQALQLLAKSYEQTPSFVNKPPERIAKVSPPVDDIESSDHVVEDLPPTKPTEIDPLSIHAKKLSLSAVPIKRKQYTLPPDEASTTYDLTDPAMRDFLCQDFDTQDLSDFTPVRRK